MQTTIPLNLTGTWNSNAPNAPDGGRWYIYHSGPEVWCYSESTPQAPGWANILYGKIYGQNLEVEWRNVPKTTFMTPGGIFPSLLMTITASDV